MLDLVSDHTKHFFFFFLMPSVITDKIMHDVKYQKLLVNVNPLWCHGHWPICHGVPLRGWWNKLTTESLACLGLISLSPFKVLVSMPAFLRLFWFGEFFCFLVIKALTSCLEKTVYTKKTLPDKNQKTPKSVDLKTKHIQAITATTRTGVDAQPQKQEVGGGVGERERCKWKMGGVRCLEVEWDDYEGIKWHIHVLTGRALDLSHLGSTCIDPT